jgi:hypothetical protein
VEEGTELQQLASRDSGEEFLQELFKKEPVCTVILQHPHLRTKTMMKRKGKALAKEHVKK